MPVDGTCPWPRTRKRGAVPLLENCHIVRPRLLLHLRNRTSVKTPTAKYRSSKAKARAAEWSGSSTMCMLPVTFCPSSVSVGPLAMSPGAYRSRKAQCASVCSQRNEAVPGARTPLVDVFSDATHVQVEVPVVAA
jgi:hypothetical protein